MRRESTRDSNKNEHRNLQATAGYGKILVFRDLAASAEERGREMLSRGRENNGFIRTILLIKGGGVL